MEYVTEEDGGCLSAHCPTIVLPALSIGNVGQLAVDLLVPSTGARRVGYLDEPSLLPCVGNDAYGPLPTGDLALPLEVFESQPHELSLIQQRSNVTKGLMLEFAKNLASFIARTGKEHVVILSGLDSGRNKEIDTSGVAPIYYLSSVCDDGTDVGCEKIGWKRLEQYNPHHVRWMHLTDIANGNSPDEDVLGFEDNFDEDYYPYLPFAALFACCKAKGLRVTCILRYCSEGDNIPDSFHLAEAVYKLLGLNSIDLIGNGVSGWRIPLSWNSVYGPPPDAALF